MSTIALTAAPTPAPTTSRRLAGKIALITGGNSGIGLAAAEEFLRAGAQVVITGRDAATLQLAAAALGELAQSEDFIALRGDVTSPQEVDHVISEVRERFGRLDVLFVNAGILHVASIADATEDDFDRVFDTNVKGAYFTIQKALPLLTRGASIILNGSINGHIGMPGTSLYAASKAAVRSLARTLSADLMERGIRVNVITPGPVSTAILGRQGLTPEALDALKANIRQQVPLKRFGDPREIALAAVFLASDESTFFVGAELVADGGLTQL
ncbi:MAG TPA: glucose 1-dehydrogenase [Gemmatimonadales bacterium]|nr:glucose 1-dehydrogenase [Gemmatimonadales bacterium]